MLLNMRRIFWCIIYVSINSLIDGLSRLYPQRKRNSVVLLVKCDALGDFVLTMPYIKGVMESEWCKGRRLVIATNAAHKQLLNIIGGIDPVEVIDIKADKMHANPIYRMKKLLTIRKLAPEVIINAMCGQLAFVDYSIVRIANPKIAFSAKAEAINVLPRKARVRFIGNILCRRMNRAYTKSFDIGQNRHETQRLREFFASLGIAPLWSPEVNHIPRYFRDDGMKKYAVIAPGSLIPQKSWRAEHFSEIGGILYSAYSMIPVLIGVKVDRPIGEGILGCASRAPWINLIGDTNLDDLVSIIAHSSIVVCNDSASLHIAMQLNIPTVCICGGGQFGRFVPYPIDMGSVEFCYFKMKCYGCNWECKHEIGKGDPFPCIDAVEVGEVKNAVRNLLSFGITDTNDD